MFVLEKLQADFQQCNVYVHVSKWFEHLKASILYRQLFNNKFNKAQIYVVSQTNMQFVAMV